MSRRVNVSFLERYNATDRHQNARKVRKTYTFSKDWRVHESMTYFTMYSYNFCWPVRTLDATGRGRPGAEEVAGDGGRAWPITSGRCASGSRCPLFNLLIPVSQGRERTASGPAGEIRPVGSVVKSRITRESRAERPLTPSG